MQLSYDPRRNIAYLRLREPAESQVETIHLSDELNVDLAPDGTIYGIELLNANEQLRGGGEGFLVLVDEITGRRIEVPRPELAQRALPEDLHAVRGEDTIARGDRDSFRERLCNHHPIKRIAVKPRQSCEAPQVRERD